MVKHMFELCVTDGKKTLIKCMLQKFLVEFGLVMKFLESAGYGDSDQLFTR